MGGDCAELLADAMRTNTTLRVLDLRWNKIGTVGATALRDVLRAENKTLVFFCFFWFFFEKLY